MKIVTEHLINAANNLEKQFNKITYQIEQINNVIYILSNLNMDDIVIDLVKCRDKLIEERGKLLKLSEVIYISLNYYKKWDMENASYCYEDRLIYSEKEKGVINLSEMKYILENMDLGESYKKDME